MRMKRLVACLVLLLMVWGVSAIEKSATIVYINGTKYYIHAVAQGETLYSLAKTYEVSEELIKEHNPALAAGLKSGQKLKIPMGKAVTAPTADGNKKKIKKNYSNHYVVKGETLYAIARQYEVPVQTLLEDNPDIDPSRLSLGQKLLIRKKAIGQATEEENREELTRYAEQLSSVTEGDDYYVVMKGDTFYSLAKRFAISEEELSTLNGGLKPQELKAGAMIRIPSTPATEQVEEQVVATPNPEQEAPEVITPDNRVIDFRAVCNCDPLKVSLLLPMTSKGRANQNYLEFYQGFLLGLDSLKTKHGYSIDLDLYDTKRDAEEVDRIVEQDRFRRSQLVVGPVYEEEMETVVKFAGEKQIPVVSPLAHISHIQSDVLFLMAPDPTKKYAKAADMIGGEKRVTLIYTESTDKEFEQEILAMLGETPYTKHQYKYQHPSIKLKEGELSPSDLTPLLDNEHDNLFIILSDNEIDVDRVLAALASADTNLRARSLGSPKYAVLGNSRWNRYQNIDRSIFFKNRVTFFSTYHAKRDSERIISFDRAYLRAFGALPTLYAYRGYDAAMIFVASMYNDIEYDLEDRRYSPLQTIYRFTQEEEHKNHLNSDWMRVNYNSDFTITIQ